MVGVPGKYKGCETCRLRRVKCDNTRPFCKKCKDNGRECAGYQRETVFIIGTPQDGGRCSSHPPRVIKSRRNRESSVGSSSNVTISDNGGGGGGGGGGGSGGGSRTSRSSPKSGSRPSSVSASSASLSALPTAPRRPPSDRQYQQQVALPEPPGSHGRPASVASSPALSVASGVGNVGNAGGSFSGPYLVSSSSASNPASTTSETLHSDFRLSPNLGTTLGHNLSQNLGQDSDRPTLDFKLAVLPLRPLLSAWEDQIAVSRGGQVYHLQFAALHLHLQGLRRQRYTINETSLFTSHSLHDGSTGRNSFVLSEFPPYLPADLRPLQDNGAGEAFQLQAQCMVHLAPLDVDVDDNFGSAPIDSICLFLYEHNHSSASTTLPSWKDSNIQSDNNIHKTGPGCFTTFPAHHFFVRVYRPTAIFAALIGRSNTCLSDPEWITMPWELHPKSDLDQLLDIVALIPALLGRADHITPHDPTMARRLLAQDLLANCLHIEQALTQWHQNVQVRTGGAVRTSSVQVTTTSSVPTGIPSTTNTSNTNYWVEDPGSTDAQIPFADTFAFRDSITAVTFVYFWSSLVLLYPCIEGLYHAVFQPTIDAFPPVYPAIPPALQMVNPIAYGHKAVRQAASNACRSLDFALATTVQPDLLSAPVFVIESFYRRINAASGDGALEILWCEALRSRLACKGQDIINVVESRRWMDAGQC